MIFVGAITIGAYMYGKQNSQPKQSLDPTPTAAVTQEAFPSPTVQPTASSVSDNELIKQALLQKHGWNENEITIKISTNDGKYANGTVSAQGGGGYFYAEKVNGVWEIVADGNGVILCSALTKYPDFPKTLIPECFDQPTGKTVKR